MPHGHCKTTSFVAGLRLAGMGATMVLYGPINGRAFQVMSIRSSARNRT